MHPTIERGLLRSARWVGIVARLLVRVARSLLLFAWMFPAVILFWLPALVLGVVLRMMVYGFHAGRRAVDRELMSDE